MKKGDKSYYMLLAVLLSVFVMPVLHSCGSARKARALQETTPVAQINLAATPKRLPGVSVDTGSDKPEQHDTIVVHDNGRDYLLMRAVKDDETGEMVATEELSAAVVTARFRNVAERDGGFVIDFNVTVPESMQNDDWQVRFRPKLVTGADTLLLDPIYITGAGYRKEQIRGYELYNRYLSRIIGDDVDSMVVFVRKHLLETYIERNIPDLWRLREDSTLVDSEQYSSIFDVTDREAIEHYTRWWKIAYNNFLKRNVDKAYSYFVRNPIVSEGLYLDTVITTSNADKVYRYTKRVNLTRNVKKADLILGGEVYTYGRKIYDMPDSDPLTHYVASLASFIDTSLHYKKEVVYRDLNVNTSTRLAFGLGKSDIDTTLGDNSRELAAMWSLIGDVFTMNDYVADSVIVTVCSSPEGSQALNERLTRSRASSFSDYLNAGLDTLGNVMTIELDAEGNELSGGRKEFPVLTRTVTEDWDGLRSLVEADTVLAENDRVRVLDAWRVSSLDAREGALRRLPSFGYVKDSLFPKLRRADMEFHLHRKGMLKDTVHTNVVDERYMQAIEDLKNYSYGSALTVLSEYGDYNAALAFLNLNYNRRAIELFERCPRTADRDYLLAIAYVRDDREIDAVTSLKKAILANPQLRWRANLDPELSELVEKYNFDDEDDEFGDLGW